MTGIVVRHPRCSGSRPCGRCWGKRRVRRLDWHNIRTAHPDRCPKVTLAELDAAGADLVLLPDESYAFSADDGPEAFDRTPTRLVSGRLLTWYGPSLLAASESLSRHT